MNYLAVIDTNVIVSAFISKNKYSPPSMIVKEMLGGRITPIINDFILEEYRDVLLRPKFHLAKDDVDSFIMRI
ncbi:MAG: putative toxin-antitoxin system toxin component, PIN family, partial [Spirochaetales bacterium]|nr:putative toxin-antitoxin system toxin component, PIN family [Spirochaetales bacterium]